MSKSVHPSKPIRDKYPNRLKKHKLQGVVLVEVEAKVVQRGENAVLVLSSPISIVSNQKVYAAKRYIHVTEEVEEGILFVIAEAVIPAARAGGIGPLEVDGNNRADGAEANDAPNFTIGFTSRYTFGRHDGASPPRDRYRR